MTARSHLDDHGPDSGSGAMVELFQQYQHALRRFFERRGGSRQDAEDLAQESFVRLVERGDAGTLEHKKPFLYRVAANLAIDTARRRACSPVAGTIEDLRDTAPTEPGDAISPERIVAGRQELALVLAALDQLPDACRTAFLLQRVEGRNHAEIAEALGISRSMVEKHVARAMLHLRATLAAAHGA